ncbi:MAG: B12-binding domain-containing radical SAM protein [Paludibacter sp.]
MKDIVFITFDIPRSDYPAMTYSIASIIASLKASGYKCGHFPIDIKQSIQDGVTGEKLTSIVKTKLLGSLEYFKGFRYIAISVTRWSVEHCNSLIDLLTDYNGKIILGGYEITATANSVLETEYPKADYFVKGYAERALVNLMKGVYPDSQRILQESLAEIDLASPYLTGVLNLFTRKIYWETKRGCRFSCGFCEWGNAEKILIELDKNRLFREIDLIRDSSVEEINILDATFNFGRNYLEILKYLLFNTELKITFQARFETLFGSVAEEFLALSTEYKSRIHMEFGLQTIHLHEMNVIGRVNNMDKIEQGLLKLNESGISYEVSIIYAIPGQTVESLIDTIEFLVLNGCKKIRAYPLQIPRNSELERKRLEYEITEVTDNLNVRSVLSSKSFSKENRFDMDNIAERVNRDEIKGVRVLPIQCNLLPTTKYQYELKSIDCLPNKKYLYNLVDSAYIKTTLIDINSEDFFDYIRTIGGMYDDNISTEDTNHFLDKVHKKEYYLKVDKKDSDNLQIQVRNNTLKIRQSKNSIRYFCNIRLGVSGNLYVYRDIVRE